MVKKLLLSLCPLLSLFAATGQAQKNMEAVRDVVERYKECFAVKNISRLDIDDYDGKIPIVHICMWQSDKVGGIVLSDDPMSFVLNFYVPSK